MFLILTLELFRAFLGSFELMSRFAQRVVQVRLVIDSMDEFIAQSCDLIAELGMMR